MTALADPPPTTSAVTADRVLEVAAAGDAGLGPFQHLPGTWKSDGHGWNMIALPFGEAKGQAPFRLLVNQFKEVLTFSLVDKSVPNRGLNGSQEGDQSIVALDYEQLIKQVAVDDEPPSRFRGNVNAPIHHEPGLFLDMTNFAEDTTRVARLATIPHGDAVLAMGTATTVDGPPVIPAVDGLPIGEPQDIDGNPYLEPYRKFHEKHFFGNVKDPKFAGFDPVAPQELLTTANAGVKITRTTVLDFDTTGPGAGINNVPFVVREADATSMKATFWINELDSGALQLQYLQIVMLEFFLRRDGLPGRIQWPHVSINTLNKTSDVGEVDPDF